MSVEFKKCLDFIFNGSDVEFHKIICSNELGKVFNDIIDEQIQQENKNIEQ